VIGELFFAPLGARWLGGSQRGVVGAICGTLVGLALFPVSVILSLLAPFLGAVVGELIGGATRTRAIRSGAGTLVGFFLASSVKLALSIAYLIVFFLSFAK